VSPTSSSNPAAQTANSSPAAPSTLDSATQGLGENAFLQLLVTQLQHQDPTQPMDDTTFIAQLAQFSSLEKLTSIDSSLKQLTQLAGAEPKSTAGGTN
jgi:flagellar basal-body rod modification protein FlgD